MSDLVDTNYPAHEKCPLCSGAPRTESRPTGPVTTCLRCGTQFIVGDDRVYETGKATVGEMVEVRRGSY
jgi:hypothetical protein